MGKVKYDTIILEGIDKSGKSTVFKYVGQMDRSYILQDRGLMSILAYDKLYGRDGKDYDLSKHKNEVFFLIEVDKKDWEIRCKLENEPPMKRSFEENMTEFGLAFDKMKAEGIFVYKVNSSEYTPYEIAKIILQTMEALNRGAK